MQDLVNLRSITSLIENKEWNRIEEYFNNANQLKHLGVTVNLQNPEEPRCDIKQVQDFHQGGVGQGFVHGGISATLADLAIGLTALPYLKDGHFATSQLNLNFLKPVPARPVYVIARTETRTDLRIMANASVFDFQGELCVYATGTIRLNITG